MRRLPRLALAVVACIAPAIVGAQASMVKIVGTDHLPVPYALVSVGGAKQSSITDEQGEVSIGKQRNVALSIQVRRLGYRVLTEMVDFPDTAATRVLTLSRETPGADAAPVSVATVTSKLASAGFYDRWLEAQRKGLGGSFIGPEAIALRDAKVTTDLLDGLVTLRVSAGIRSARSYGKRPAVAEPLSSVATFSDGDKTGECFMNVMIDRRLVCPSVGCHYVFANDPPGSTAADHSVDLDRLLSPKDVAGIEFGGGRQSSELLRNADNGCGVIMIWTKR